MGPSTGWGIVPKWNLENPGLELFKFTRSSAKIRCTCFFFFFCGGGGGGVVSIIRTLVLGVSYWGSISRETTRFAWAHQPTLVFGLSQAPGVVG